MLFGKGRNEEEARERLAQLVTRNIDRVDQLCKLTSQQKDKLEVAGRGDIDRFLRRVKELAPQLERVYDEYEAERVELDDAVNRLLEETRPLRGLLDSGHFGPESLFTKTLRTTLTAEQAAAYEKATAPDSAERDAKE